MMESGKKLSAFCIGEIRMDEKFYRTAFLNFLGVLLSGIHEDAVMISVNDGEIKAQHTGSSGSASAKMTEEEVIHKFLSLDIAEEPEKIIHTILDEDIEDLAVYLNHLNQ